jgi:hypothetical protein
LPRPGKPAAPFTAGAAVGPMQKSAASVGVDASCTGVLRHALGGDRVADEPLSKHSRKRATEQVSPANPQSALLVQPRNVSVGPQNCSNGPLEQMKSVALVAGKLSPGTQSPEPPSHWFGAVAVPGTLHALPGHCDVALQGAPAFVPPAHR